MYLRFLDNTKIIIFSFSALFFYGKMSDMLSKLFVSRENYVSLQYEKASFFICHCIVSVGNLFFVGMVPSGQPAGQDWIAPVQFFGKTGREGWGI